MAGARPFDCPPSAPLPTGCKRRQRHRQAQPTRDLAPRCAHALALGAILVTHDAAFKRIENLKVEDWTK